jgi:hypothetical protein
MPCKKCEEGKYKWGETGECKYDTLEACESANTKYNKMQPTPLGKKTYEEYEKELKEYNLSKVEKVELALMDDIVKAVKEARKLMGVAENQGLSSLKKVIISVENDFVKGYRASSDGIELIEKLEKKLKELGIENPSELQGYDNLFRSWQSLADTWIDQLNADQYR